MTDPFVAEIRIMGFNFAPTGWAQCSGQLLPISQNTALFSLLGTYYGGNGKTTFALPDLTGGRVPISSGQGPGLSDRFLGEAGGEEAVSLLQSELPTHGHTLTGTTTVAEVSAPTNTTLLARSQGKAAYAAASGLTPMQDATIGYAPGGGQPHNNMIPYLVLNYCIALQGIFPPRG